MMLEKSEQHESQHKISQPAIPVSQRCPSFRLARFQKGSGSQRTDKEGNSHQVAVKEDDCIQANTLGVLADYQKCSSDSVIEVAPCKQDDISQLRAELKRDLEDSKLMMNVLDKMPTECLALERAAGGGSSAARLIRLSRESSAQMSGGMLRLLAKSKEELSSACSTAPPSFETLPDFECTEDGESTSDDESDEEEDSDGEVTPDPIVWTRGRVSPDESLKEAELLMSVLDKMPSAGRLSPAQQTAQSEQCSARLSGGMLRSSATCRKELSKACNEAPPSFDSLPDVQFVEDDESDQESEVDEVDF